MSFFVMPSIFTVVGRFKMVQSTMSLSSNSAIHLHLFETPLNGSFVWAFDKKRHTHAHHTVLRFLSAWGRLTLSIV